MIDKQKIERVATQIGIACDAKSVILVGPHARENAREDSDVDVLVIAESDFLRFKRSRVRYKLFRPSPFVMDLTVCTPQEIEKGKESPVSVV